MSGLKTFVVRFMIRMSKVCLPSSFKLFNIIMIQDFATSSLKGEVATENQEEIPVEETLQEYQIDTRKQWEQRY